MELGHRRPMLRRPFPRSRRDLTPDPRWRETVIWIRVLGAPVVPVDEVQNHLALDCEQPPPAISTHRGPSGGEAACTGEALLHGGGDQRRAKGPPCEPEQFGMVRQQRFAQSIVVTEAIDAASPRPCTR